MKQLFFTFTFITISLPAAAADCILASSAPSALGILAMLEQRHSGSHTPCAREAMSLSSSPQTPRRSPRHSRWPSMTLEVPAASAPTKVTTGFEVPLPLTPASSSAITPLSAATPVAELAQIVTPPSPYSATAWAFTPLQTLTRNRYTTTSQPLTTAESRAIQHLGGVSVSAFDALLTVAYNFAPTGRQDFLVWLAASAPQDERFRAALANPTNQTAIWDTLLTRYNKAQGKPTNLSDLALQDSAYWCEKDLTEKAVKDAFDGRADTLTIAAVLAQARRAKQQTGTRVWSTQDDTWYMCRQAGTGAVLHN